MTRRRRDVLRGVVPTLVLVTGCQRETYSNTTPEAIGLAVNNQSSAELQIAIQVKREGETVETYDLRLASGETQTQRTTLQGKTYDVVVEYTELPNGGTTQTEQEWIWGACDTDDIVVTVFDDRTTVGRACSDD